MRFTNGVHVGVRHGIHEVDGVGSSVFHRKLDAVQVVAKRAAKLERIFFHLPVEQAGVQSSGPRGVFQVALGVRPARIVGHDADSLLPNYKTAKIFGELDRLLKDHAQVAGLVEGAEELVAAAHLVHVAPASAIDGLEETVLADGGKHAIPVEGKLEVAHRLVGCSVGKLLMREKHGGRHGHAEIAGQRIVEKLVVGRSPEGIVDDRRAVKRRVLEIRAIKRDIVGDAIEDDRVVRRLIERDSAGEDELGLDAGGIASVNSLDQRARKTVLHAEQDADLFHAPVLRTLRRGRRVALRTATVYDGRQQWGRV